MFDQNNILLHFKFKEAIINGRSEKTKLHIRTKT